MVVIEKPLHISFHTTYIRKSCKYLGKYPYDSSFLRIFVSLYFSLQLPQNGKPPLEWLYIFKNSNKKIGFQPCQLGKS